MKRSVTDACTILFFALATYVHAETQTGAATTEILSAAEWGHYELVRPAETPKELAFLFVPGADPDTSDQQATAALLKQGYAVARVHGAAYLEWIKHPPGKRPADLCLDLSGALEWTAQALEKRLGFADYRPPILVGRGLGAALAYIHLAQAQAHAMRAGLGFDFDRTVPSGTPLCRFPPPVNGVVQLTDKHDPPAWHTAEIAPNATDKAAGYEHGVDHFIEAIAANGQNRTADESALADLPLVEVAKDGPRKMLVVVYSGDGGWRDIDKQVAELLAKEGFAVLGVDSLRYFWDPKKPDRLGTDLRRILAEYLDRWNLCSVVLVGYSFGADVLPFAFNRLPAEQKDKVNRIVLIAPSLTTDFEIHVANWLGASTDSDAVPIAPEAARLPAGAVTCIDAADEADESLCGQPGPQHFENIRLPGGHHFDGDYRTLTAKIVASVESGSNPH